MLKVPLSAVPDQTLSITLGGQACQIALRQNGGNMYFDLTSNSAPVVTCRIARNIQRLLLDAKYRGFVGDFFFYDSQGDTDPQYTGLGDSGRYALYYLEATDL